MLPELIYINFGVFALWAVARKKNKNAGVSELGLWG